MCVMKFRKYLVSSGIIFALGCSESPKTVVPVFPHSKPEAHSTVSQLPPEKPVVSGNPQLPVEVPEKDSLIPISLEPWHQDDLDADSDSNADPVPRPASPIVVSTADVEPRLATDLELNPSVRESVGGIHFDSAIPVHQYNLMAKDLHAIHGMGFEDTDGEMTRIMDIPRVSGSEILQWIEERVQLFLAQNRGRWKADPRLSADNFGAAIYAQHKSLSLNFFSSLFLTGFEPIVMSSPRTGLVRIGPGLFNSVRGVGEQTASRVRLGTYVHEARHSDGNGESLAFSHILCPSGHDFQGLAACDSSLNGSYTVGGLFFNAAQRGCNECTARGKAVLSTLAADQFSRVIRTNDTTDWDASPEGERSVVVPNYNI